MSVPSNATLSPAAIAHVTGRGAIETRSGADDRRVMFLLNSISVVYVASVFCKAVEEREPGLQPGVSPTRNIG